jgi:hypothetical protein
MDAISPRLTAATNSYGLLIRDGLYDILTANPAFAGYTVRKNKMIIMQEEYLPFLSVYILDETMGPDGDINAGEIRFIHNLRVGFSVLIADNDQDALETAIDAAWWSIMTGLWPNNGVTNVMVSKLPDNVEIEGVVRGVRRHVFGVAQLHNQTPVAELQYEATIVFRSTWPPLIPDDFLTLDVKTGVKAGDTPAEMAQRYQEHAQYDFSPIPAPTVTSIYPTSGPTTGGTRLLINGTNFIEVASVNFGADEVSFIVDSDTALTIVTLAGNGTVDIVVTTTSGTSPITAVDQFTFT